MFVMLNLYKKLLCCTKGLVISAIFMSSKINLQISNEVFSRKADVRIRLLDQFFSYLSIAVSRECSYIAVLLVFLRFKNLNCSGAKRSCFTARRGVLVQTYFLQAFTRSTIFSDSASA